ncbi:MAG: transglycosylase SLT domain-containing protein [Candidatus Anstonellales archaeon]
MLVVVNITPSDLYSLESCKAYIQDVRSFHRQYFGTDFPYWYSVAQLEKESSCRHNILSSDRVGSEGLAQITYSLWKDKLSSEGIKEIKTISNHLKAQAYINKYYYTRLNHCDKKLWAMYQAYNGGFLVEKECRLANSSVKSEARKFCNRRDVCIRFKGNKCIQYRNACDINYEYSDKIYKLSGKYNLLDIKTTNFVFY